MRIRADTVGRRHIRRTWGQAFARIRVIEEVIPMDKEILKQYIDACEQVKEAKVDILRLKKNRKKIVQDRVSGVGA